jgi:hypothetical protein
MWGQIAGAALGALGGALGGGGGTEPTTKTTDATTNAYNSYPQWAVDAARGAIGTGQNLAQPFLQQSPYGVAGFTIDQVMGMDLGRKTLRNAYQAPNYAGDMMGAGTQFGPDSYKAFMNPYIQDVVNTTRQTMQSDLADRQAATGARYAGMGSFGGSGEAIARGQAERAHGEQLSTVTANLMAQGYDRATANALAASQNNQGRIQSASGLHTEQQSRQMSALAQLMMGGNMQQQLAQQSLDAPWTAYQRMLQSTPMGAIPGYTHSNTHSVETSEGGGAKSNPIGQAIGGGMMGWKAGPGIFGGLSGGGGSGLLNAASGGW